MKVKELLTRDLTAIESDATVEDLVRLLAASGLSGVPVVDELGKVIGFISEQDVIEAVLPGYFERLAMPSDPLGHLARKYQEIKGKRVEELMSRDVATVTEEDEGVTVADLMIRNDLKTVPVVDSMGRLAGVVRLIDLLRHCFTATAEAEEEDEG